MSAADPDGRILQVARDRLACLQMEFAEFLRELRADMEAKYGPDFDERWRA